MAIVVMLASINRLQIQAKLMLRKLCVIWLDLIGIRDTRSIVLEMIGGNLEWNHGILQKIH
jgi:hypothetical protein